uniref:Uncharacterized protein n=1 Tax=Opuntia streptacantha TaxID=393608 RepID=A0A7C9ENC9_OPUST
MASIISSLDTASPPLRAASNAASLTMLARSAPTRPWVREAMRLQMSCLSSSKGMSLKCTASIFLLPSSSGSPTTTFLENRPGRQRAWSSASGLLVAAMTTTFASDSNPSISVSNWLSV